jgi:hypothetical protein
MDDVFEGRDMDLGPDPEPDFPDYSEWEKLADEDAARSKGSLYKDAYFGDEFDARRAEDELARRKTIGEIPDGAKERVLGKVRENIDLQGLNRRVRAYGVAGTLADMAAAYALADGTPMERGYEAAKGGLMGAGAGAGLQASLNLTGRLGALAGRAIPFAAGLQGAWNIGKAARGAYDWHGASEEAEQERLGSEAKYGNKEKATATRHAKEKEAAMKRNKARLAAGGAPAQSMIPDQVVRPNSPNDQFRRNARQALFLYNEELPTTKRF